MPTVHPPSSASLPAISAKLRLSSLLLTENSRDFLAGMVGGVAGVVGGQPLDTVRVRLQQPGMAYINSSQTWRLTVQQEGPLALFKGMGYPLATIPVNNAVIFASFATANRLLQTASISKDWSDMQRTFAAGVCSGFVQSVVAAPVELLKIRLQVQVANKGLAGYIGPRQQLSSLVRTNTLFKGLGITMARDMPFFGLYFLTYEGFKGLFSRQKGFLGFEPVSVLMAGGLAGVFGWLAVYPTEMIKGRFQADNKQLYSSVWKCISMTYKQEGYAGFYKGLSPTLVRAFLSNAATFAAYELALTALKSYSGHHRHAAESLAGTQ